MRTALVWFRRDPRVRDNPALAEAGSGAACVFVAEPTWIGSKPWKRDPDAAAAWLAGATGEAAVDAAMHQLAAEGRISDTARMLVASYLTRDLRLDWRDGARHFMRTLLDGDPAVNALNWQWFAGTGYDVPAPSWRPAPDRQLRRHDPDGSWAAAWEAA